MDLQKAIGDFNSSQTKLRVSIGKGQEPLGFVAILDGSLETSNSSSLQQLLCALVTDGNIGKRLILDLSKVVYMSSTGIGALTFTLSACMRVGVELMLSRVPEHVASLLDILGFNKFFKIIGDYEPSA